MTWKRPGYPDVIGCSYLSKKRYRERSKSQFQNSWSSNLRHTQYSKGCMNTYVITRAKLPRPLSLLLEGLITLFNFWLI